MITKADIEMLFDDLWPMMYHSKIHKQNCLNSLVAIQHYFKISTDDNILLKNLRSLDGIGLTIASGLIWSVNQYSRVPFDKYTLTFALVNKIIPSEYISKDYINNCLKVTQFCEQFEIDGRAYDVRDFVREAVLEMEFKQLIEPK